MVPLMERYPEVPGFVKFKSRFLMERARNGIDMVEAELYIDEHCGFSRRTGIS